MTHEVKTWEPLKCPMLELDSEWDDAGDERLWTPARCDASLHLVCHWVEDLYEDSTAEDFTELGTKRAEAWEVECENGHKLLASGDPDNVAPFDPAWVRNLSPGVEQTNG